MNTKSNALAKSDGLTSLHKLSPLAGFLDFSVLNALVAVLNIRPPIDYVSFALIFTPPRLYCLNGLTSLILSVFAEEFDEDFVDAYEFLDALLPYEDMLPFLYNFLSPPPFFGSLLYVLDDFAA